MSWSDVSSSALFCPRCHSLLDLPDPENNLNCLCCSFTLKASEAQHRNLETQTRSSRAKNLIQEHLHVDPNASRAIVKEICPKCNHGKMYFYTMQLRSADEGQTVFYECIKCNLYARWYRYKTCFRNFGKLTKPFISFHDMGCITSSDADSLPKSAVVEIKMISVIAPPKVELFRVDRVLNLLKDLNLSVEDQTQLGWWLALKYPTVANALVARDIDNPIAMRWKLSHPLPSHRAASISPRPTPPLDLTRSESTPAELPSDLAALAIPSHVNNAQNPVKSSDQLPQTSSSSSNASNPSNASVSKLSDASSASSAAVSSPSHASLSSAPAFTSHQATRSPSSSPSSFPSSPDVLTGTPRTMDDEPLLSSQPDDESEHHDRHDRSKARTQQVSLAMRSVGSLSPLLKSLPSPQLPKPSISVPSSGSQV